MPDMIPRGLDFMEQAPLKFETSVHVEATPSEVWDVLTDNEHWPDWFPAAKACRTTSETGEGVGATRWIHFDIFKADERYVAWDPPARWGFTVLDANFPGIISVVEEYVISPLDGGSRLDHTFAADLAGYLRPIVPILRWRNRMLFRKGLAGIQAQVEKLREE